MMKWFFAGTHWVAVQKNFSKIAIYDHVSSTNHPFAAKDGIGILWEQEKASTSIDLEGVSTKTLSSSQDEPIKVIFILQDAIPPSMNGGLMALLETSLVLQARPLFQVRVAILEGSQHVILQDFPAAEEFLIVYNNFSHDLLQTPSQFDVVVATYFVTLWMAEELIFSMQQHHNVAASLIYFVQDYEPWFFGGESFSLAAIAAKLSYVWDQNATIVAYSEWIRRQLWDNHGAHSLKVHCHPRQYDRAANRVRRHNRFTIAAMIRPNTPRRAAALTIKVLSLLHDRFTDVGIRIISFG